MCISLVPLRSRCQNVIKPARILWTVCVRENREGVGQAGLASILHASDQGQVCPSTCLLGHQLGACLGRCGLGASSVMNFKMSLTEGPGGPLVNIFPVVGSLWCTFLWFPHESCMIVHIIETDFFPPTLFQQLCISDYFLRQVPRNGVAGPWYEIYFWIHYTIFNISK